MQFRCNIGKLGVQQLALASVVDSLYRNQSLECIITWLDPMKFELKNNMPEIMAKRLLADKIEIAIPGYVGEIKDGQLVVSKKSKQPNNDE